MQEKTALEFKSIKEVLDYAVKSEENARDFYLAWAEKVEDRSMAGLFKDLAAEETKHKEFLLGLKEGGLTPSEEEIVNLGISDYVLPTKLATDMDYQDALHLAMQREKEAFKLYSNLSKMAKDENIKTTFKGLAQEEAKHKLKLEIIYDEEVMKEN